MLRDARRQGLAHQPDIAPQRRRIVGAILCGALVVAAGVVFGGLPSQARSASTRGQVSSTSFTGAFQPNQVTATNGEVWLMSPETSTSASCRIGRFDPATAAMHTYRLASCGMNISGGDDAVFIEVAAPERRSQTYAIHIERFSTLSHTSMVYRTISASMPLGSAIAHTQLAFADGFLWFYGGPGLVQLSPSTGAVERTFRSVPPIGGTEPIIAAAPGYVWVAGGAGSGAVFLRIDVRTGSVDSIRPAGTYNDVFALASAGNDLYFSYLANPVAGEKTVTSHLARLTSDGLLAGVSPNEALGSSLVRTSGRLYTVGPGETCGSEISISGVNEETLRPSNVADLVTPGDPCLGLDSFRSVVATGGRIYVLYSTALDRADATSVLYLVTP